MPVNQPPLISVIVPVFNGETSLPRCLDSLLRQDHARLEILVVDDGSTDRTPQILAGYAARDPRLRVVRQENAGQGAARNRALALCRGSFVGFADADDYAEPALFSSLLQALEANGADIACCAYWTDGAESRLQPLPDRTLSAAEAYALLVDNRVLKHFLWNKLFRRSAIEGIAMPEGRIFEDIVFLTRCLARCRKFVLLSRPLYHYCENPSSTSRALSLEKRYQYLLATHEEQLFGLERGILPPRQRDRIVRRSLHLVNRLLTAAPGPGTDRLLRSTLEILHAYDGLRPASPAVALRRRLVCRHLPAYARAYRFFRSLRKKKD